MICIFLGTLHPVMKTVEVEKGWVQVMRKLRPHKKETGGAPLSLSKPRTCLLISPSQYFHFLLLFSLIRLYFDFPNTILNSSYVYNYKVVQAVTMLGLAAGFFCLLF